MRKVRATLDGDKLSDLDARVFGSVLKRQKNELFFTYLNRRSRLSKLSLEDKQRLIESEKKRLIAEEKRKRAMLDDYVSGKQSNRTPAQVHSDEVQNQVSDTLSNRLSSLDTSIFDSLASRKESEQLFAYLKRSKAMYGLPVEEKQQLVNAEKSRIQQEQESRQRMLEEYLTPTSDEKISQIKSAVSESTENAVSMKRKIRKFKGLSQ